MKVAPPGLHPQENEYNQQPIENNTREDGGNWKLKFLQPTAKSKPSVPRVDASSSSRDLAPAEPAEPEEGGGESELPPVVSEEAPAKEEEDDGPMPIPDWSSFDLGRCLHALKSEKTSIIVRALKRLHIRWYHCSSARMQALLQLKWKCTIHSGLTTPTHMISPHK